MEGCRRILFCILCALLLLVISACIATADPELGLPPDAEVHEAPGPTSAPAAEPAVAPTQASG